MHLNDNMRERIKGSFIGVLDIHFIETDIEQELDATMLIREDLLQTSHVLHGGVTIAFAETLAGVASNKLCAADEYAFGIQISANHISHGQLGDTIIGKAISLHIGRSTHVWDVNVYSEKTGKIISSVKVTNMIIKKK